MVTRLPNIEECLVWTCRYRGCLTRQCVLYWGVSCVSRFQKSTRVQSLNPRGLYHHPFSFSLNVCDYFIILVFVSVTTCNISLFLRRRSFVFSRKWIGSRCMNGIRFCVRVHVNVKGWSTHHHGQWLVRTTVESWSCISVQKPPVSCRARVFSSVASNESWVGRGGGFHRARQSHNANLDADTDAESHADTDANVSAASPTTRKFGEMIWNCSMPLRLS